MRGESVSRPEAVHAARAFAFAGAAAGRDALATLVAMRLQRSGVIAGLAYLVVGLAWSLITQTPLYLIAWLFVVAVAGSYIPGEANQVSLARAYLAVPALAYAITGRFALLAVVVAEAGLTDLVDGTVARRFGRPSQFGGPLDPVVDGVFMGALCVGLAVGGHIPLWLALVVIARYLLPALAGGLLIASGRRLELRHRLTGQLSTVLIVVLIGGGCVSRGLHQDSSGVLGDARVVVPIATLATYVHLRLALRRRNTAPTPG